MLEGGIRVGFLVVMGLIVGLAVIWYLSVIYQEVVGTGRVVIEPFNIVQEDGKFDDKLGLALAQMLQARFQALARELQDAQTGLTTNATAQTLTAGKFYGPLTGVQFFNQRIGLQTTLCNRSM
jgi:hypothetical protein